MSLDIKAAPRDWNRRGHGTGNEVPMHDQPTAAPHGYCQCGCGDKAPIAGTTDNKRGYVRGQPRRYIHGHGPRRKGPWLEHREDPRARWEQFVDKTPDGCWLWTGSLVHGYGQLNVNGRPARAHRLAYEWFVGPIPAGLMICHRCNVKACVNPDHLYAGTALDNAQDAQDAGALIGNRNRGQASGSGRISDADALKLRAERRAGTKLSVLMGRYGLSESGVCAVCFNRSYLDEIDGGVPRRGRSR